MAGFCLWFFYSIAMLLFTTAPGRELDARQPPRCSFYPASLVKFQRHLPHVVRHISVNFFWAHRSYKKPLPVVVGIRWRIVGDVFFMRPQGTCPRKRAASRHPARSRRGCLIAKATHSGNHRVKPRRFRHQPVFACVLRRSVCLHSHLYPLSNG